MTAGSDAVMMRNHPGSLQRKASPNAALHVKMPAPVRSALAANDLAARMLRTVPMYTPASIRSSNSRRSCSAVGAGRNARKSAQTKKPA